MKKCGQESDNVIVYMSTTLSDFFGGESMVTAPSKPRTVGRIILIEADKIAPNKNQPRAEFPMEELESLARSIKENGLIQPLTVRQTGDYYELIAGERRLRAAKMARLKAVPCIVMEIDDQTSAVYALIENLQRQQLSFIEEAKAIKTLIQYYGMRQEEVASSLGKTQSAVSNLLRVLRLPPEIQDELISNGLTQRHARALLSLAPEQQKQALSIIIEKKLNVEQTERLVENLTEQAQVPHRKRKIFFNDVKIFIKTIDHAVKTMQSAGISATCKRSEDDSNYTFTVTVPKAAAEKRPRKQT